MHPWLRHRDITDWCRRRGVVVQAYSPLTRTKRFGDPALAPTAAKYGKTPAQVLVRWSLQAGLVPLPKSSTGARIAENAAVYDFELTPDEMAALETDEYSPVVFDSTVSTLDE